MTVTDASACADPSHALPVRVVTDKAWHALFSQCLLRPARSGQAMPPYPLAGGLTILCASGMRADETASYSRARARLILCCRRFSAIGLRLRRSTFLVNISEVRSKTGVIGQLTLFRG